MVQNHTPPFKAKIPTPISCGHLLTYLLRQDHFLTEEAASVPFSKVVP